jgi:hypothetical protein
MKIVYVVLCIAMAASSCNDSTETTQMAPLQSDTTFVVKPELPVQEPEAVAEKAVEEEKPVAPKKKASSRSTSSTAANSNQSNQSSTGTQENSDGGTGTTEPTKKGWSKTAKGAVIGGVVGAGTGAIVNKKNRAAGAVIGGVIGAGAGAVIGNEMDKKDGRH